MHSPDPNNHLRQTLRAWSVVPPVHPNFRPAVWARIREQEPSGWVAYARGHAAGLALAAFVTLFASGWAGHSVSRAKLEAARDARIVSYLVELDPRVQAGLRP